MKLIDMHVHTNASDGVLSPEEAVQRAIENGLSGIAITDHDTVTGAIATDLLEIPNDFTVIKGIEFSTVQNNKEIHILGYNLDVYNKDFQKLLKDIQFFRSSRVHKILDKLKRFNIILEYKEIQGTEPPESIGRPHVAKALIRKGFVRDISEAFDRYLAKGRLAYVERYKLETKEAIELIKDLGGFSVLAHPGLLSDQDISSVLEKGVEGIEVFHPKHGEFATKKLYNLAKEQDLIITGGSDFHDFSPRTDNDIGSYTVLIEPFL
jgi:3',5'-nucleoside bisphosphate phosphatase